MFWLEKSCLQGIASSSANLKNSKTPSKTFSCMRKQYLSKRLYKTPCASVYNWIYRHWKWEFFKSQKNNPNKNSSEALSPSNKKNFGSKYFTCLMISIIRSKYMKMKKIQKGHNHHLSDFYKIWFLKNSLSLSKTC